MEHPEYIEPSFNIRLLRTKLEDATLSTKDKSRLLMGLHYKLHHLPPSEMRRFLDKAGYPKEVVELGYKVAKSCEICAPWALKMTKPTAAGGTIATFFNERIQTDLFDLWGRTYAIWVDEAIRWALSEHLIGKTA